jgi:hypothetical protein
MREPIRLAFPMPSGELARITVEPDPDPDLVVEIDFTGTCDGNAVILGPGSDVEAALVAALDAVREARGLPPRP